MKRFLFGSFALSTLAIVAGLGRAAEAADMPVKAPPLPLIYNWSGLYVGLNAGYAAGRATDGPSIVAPNCDMGACPPLVALVSLEQNMRSSGFTGGLQAGANYQLGSLVVGLEADINSFRLRNSFGFGPVRPAPAFPVRVTGSGSVNTDWLATFRPRVGFAIDRFLVFATGGLAITNQNDSFNDLFVTGPGGPFTGTIGNFNVTSSRSVGWTAGGGVEYAFAPRWSLKAEYLHLDFGSVTATVGVTNLPPPAFCPCGLTAASLNVRSHLTTDVGRVGLNYRLN